MAQTEPRELPVATCQSVVTPLESAWTSVGTSEQSWFEWTKKPVVISVSWPSWVGMLDESEFEWSQKYAFMSLSWPSWVGVLDESEFE